MLQCTLGYIIQKDTYRSAHYIDCVFGGRDSQAPAWSLLSFAHETPLFLLVFRHHSITSLPPLPTLSSSMVSSSLLLLFWSKPKSSLGPASSCFSSLCSRSPQKSYLAPCLQYALPYFLLNKVLAPCPPPGLRTHNETALRPIISHCQQLPPCHSRSSIPLASLLSLKHSSQAFLMTLPWLFILYRIFFTSYNPAQDLYTPPSFALFKLVHRCHLIYAFLDYPSETAVNTPNHLYCSTDFLLYKNHVWNFPGAPVAKTPGSQFRGPRFSPWPGN